MVNIDGDPACVSNFERIGFHVPPQAKESMPRNCRVRMIFRRTRMAGESRLHGRIRQKDKTGAARCCYSRGAGIDLAIVLGIMNPIMEGFGARLGINTPIASLRKYGA